MIDFKAIEDKQREVDRKSRALDTLRAKAADTSSHITGMPHGGSDGKKMERAVVDLVDMQSSLRIAEEELKGMRRELSVYIHRLRKWQYKDTLKKRYMEGKTIQCVCEEIGYEWSQTNRYLNEAKKLVMNMQK